MKTSPDPTPPSRWVALALAAVLVALTLGLRALLVGVTGGRPMFILFVLPVLAGAYACGLFCGASATVLSALALKWLVLPPTRGLVFASAVDIAQWLSFCLVGVAVSALIEWLRRARRSAEERARELDVVSAQQRLFIEHAPAAIAMFDRDMRYLAVSRRFASDYNIDPEHVIGRSHYEVFPDIPERWREAHRRCLEGAVERCDDDSFLRADGRVDALRWEILPWRDARGLIGGLVIFSEVVTEQRRVAAQVRESEARYRVIVEQAAVGIALVDARSGRFREVNPGFCEMLGYSRDEMLSRRWEDFTHPDDVEANRASVDAMHASRTLMRAEKRYVRRDGDVVWTSLTVTPLSEEDSTAQIAVAVDITERKRAEEAQRARSAAEDQLARVVASVPGVLCALVSRADGSSFAPYASPGVFDLLGFTARQLAADASLWLAHVHPDDRAVLLGDFHEKGRAGQRWHGVYRYLHPTRGLRWIDGTAVPRMATSGDIEWFTYLADVTEHQAAQGALRESEVRFRALIEKSSDMLVVLDQEYKVTLWSASATGQLGWTSDEVMGRSILDIVHPDDRARGAEIGRELSGAPGATKRFVIRHLHKNGSSRLLEVFARNLIHEPAVRGIVSNLRDVTEQQRLTEQFQQAQRLESVGRLAGGVAHDFNNLLTVIMSCAEALREDLDRGGAVNAEDVEEISAAGERARDLTRQLLAFARKQVIAPVTLDLNDVVRRSQKMLARLLGEDVELRVELQPGLWAMHGDPGQIEQVIMNLAVNARDAMPRGGRLTIETRNASVDDDDARGDDEARVGEWVRVVVSDTGTGMSQEVLAHVCEPFFTTKAQGKGTGLGLATVYGIVKQAEGHVHVTSVVERGTSFTLCFPRLVRVSTPASQLAPPAARGGAETVLVAEDEVGVRTVIARALRGAGYRVLLASSGGEALALASKEDVSVDILLTDVVMPGVDGRSLVETLKRARPALKVLYISGYTDEVIGEHGVLEPGVELLPKPFTPTTLLQRVRQVLDAP